MLELDIFQGCLPLTSISIAPFCFRQRPLLFIPLILLIFGFRVALGREKGLYSSLQCLTWIVPLRKNSLHPRGNRDFYPPKLFPLTAPAAGAARKLKHEAPITFLITAPMVVGSYQRVVYLGSPTPSLTTSRRLQLTGIGLLQNEMTRKFASGSLAVLGQTNKKYFSISDDIFFTYFNFISNMRSFIQKGELVHEEAAVRHNTRGFGAQ